MVISHSITNTSTGLRAQVSCHINETWLLDEQLTKSMTKFDGTNFQLWKFQIVSLLTTHEIYDVVNGDRPHPGDAEATAAARKRWIKENSKAMFLISAAIHYSQLSYLTTCRTAKEMWDKLKAIHEQKSASIKLILLQKFHEYTMASNDSVV